MTILSTIILSDNKNNETYFLPSTQKHMHVHCRLEAGMGDNFIVQYRLCVYTYFISCCKISWVVFSFSSISPILHNTLNPCS